MRLPLWLSLEIKGVVWLIMRVAVELRADGMDWAKRAIEKLCKIRGAEDDFISARRGRRTPGRVNSGGLLVSSVA